MNDNDRFKTEPDFAAKTVRECWTIVREETEYWQELANKATDKGDRDLIQSYLNIRNALDRVAQRIKVGE